MYVKNCSYQNMSIIKVGLPFKYSSKTRLIFNIEKWLWKSVFCCFRPLILKRPKGRKYFHCCFRCSLAFLISYRCLQKNKLGTLRPIWSFVLEATWNSILFQKVEFLRSQFIRTVKRSDFLLLDASTDLIITLERLKCHLEQIIWM